MRASKSYVPQRQSEAQEKSETAEHWKRQQLQKKKKKGNGKEKIGRKDRQPSSKTPVLAVTVVIHCFAVARARTSWRFWRKDRLDAQALLCFWRVSLQSISGTPIRDSA
jgi:hypothetical protein